MPNTHPESSTADDHQRSIHPRLENVVPEPIVTDSELMIRRAFSQSPVKGYELMFNRYYKPMCSHAVRFVYDRQLAEDIVVDTFAHFWHKRLDLTVTTSFRAYLFTMVRHRAFAHLRKEFGGEAITTISLDTESIADRLTPLQLLQFNELQLKINQTIQSASCQGQKVFVMSRFEGKKNRQIAEELGLSIKTVEGHITKILAILRQVLRQNELLIMAGLLGFGLTAQGVAGWLWLLETVTKQNL